MPVYSRGHLRQRLGLAYLGDTILRTNEGSLGTAAESVYVMSPLEADTAYSGQHQYRNTWFYVNDGEYRVASFNCASGALVSGMRPKASTPFGDPYEHHLWLRPNEKNAAIDEAIRRTPIRRNVHLPAVSGARFYSVETSASPHAIREIVKVFFNATPSINTDRGRQDFVEYGVMMTPTGLEVRVDPPLNTGQQLVLDAVLELSLGSTTTATIDIPDDRWIVVGAAERAYALLEQRPPSGGDSAFFAQQRVKMEGEFERLTALYGPRYDAPPKPDETA